MRLYNRFSSASVPDKPTIYCLLTTVTNYIYMRACVCLCYVHATGSFDLDRKEKPLLYHLPRAGDYKFQKNLFEKSVFFYFFFLKVNAGNVVEYVIYRV